MKKGYIVKMLGFTLYAAFIAFSFITGYVPGKEIGENFIKFSMNMLKVLPCAFILIGLFEVWVKKETVVKHFGEKSGFQGYIWVVLLAGTTVGGLYVAFPIAYSLYNKGAKLSVIFTYIGAAALCRIPMIIFESSFMGIKFTIIRLFVSLPLVIITSIIMGNYLEKRSYRIKEGR